MCQCPQLLVVLTFGAQTTTMLWGDCNIMETPDDFYQAVGALIRQARERQGLTQTELAEAVGLGRTSLTNIELGRQRFLLHKLWEIARVLKIDITLLLPRLSSSAPEVLSPEEIKAPPDLSQDKLEELIGRVLGRPTGDSPRITAPSKPPSE